MKINRRKIENAIRSDPRIFCDIVGRMGACRQFMTPIRILTMAGNYGPLQKWWKSLGYTAQRNGSGWLIGAGLGCNPVSRAMLKSLRRKYGAFETHNFAFKNFDDVVYALSVIIHAIGVHGYNKRLYLDAMRVIGYYRKGKLGEMTPSYLWINPCLYEVEVYAIIRELMIKSPRGRRMYRQATAAEPTIGIGMEAIFAAMT